MFLECVAFLRITKKHLLVLHGWLNQHKSVEKKKQKKKHGELLYGRFGDVCRQKHVDHFFLHGQYKEYLRSSFIKHVVTGDLQSSSTCNLFYLSSRPVLTETPTATLLCEFYWCLPNFGSPQVELCPRSLSCGFASDGARRTSWRPSWRGGAGPGWRSALLK